MLYCICLPSERLSDFQYIVLYVYQPVFRLPPNVESKILVFSLFRKFPHKSFLHFAKIALKNVENKEIFLQILTTVDFFAKNTGANARDRMKNVVYFARIWIMFAKIFAKTQN